MGDQPTDRPRVEGDQPATDHADHRPLLTLDEAADALGITVNAVRQRIKRGTVVGHKTADGWLVDINRPTVVEGYDQPTGDRPTTVHGRGRQPTDHGDQAAIAVLRELLEAERAALADERAKVERLIEASTVWQMRAHRLEDQVKALTAGDEDPRQDARVEPSAAPGRVDAPDVGQETHIEGGSWLVHWWRRVRGRQGR